MLCMHKTTSSASLVLKFVLSSTTHISTNSHPFLVGIVSLSSNVSQRFHYQSKPSQCGWRLWNKLVSMLTHTGTLTLEQPLGPWYYKGEQLHQKWTAMIAPSTSTIYINKPHGIEAHHPVNSMYRFSHHHHM